MIDELVALAHRLGDPSLTILGEGNCSEGLSDGTFWVKASGACMGEATAKSFVRMAREPVVSALDNEFLDDAAVRAALNVARVDRSETAVASTEAFMHAWLLGLPGVHFVGHTHPPDLLALLSTDSAKEIASRRLFPDEIVCCGPAACYVDYVMPGLPLARAIRSSVEEFSERLSILPKTIWLQNHGLIALGVTPAEVMVASQMSVKAARVWQLALATGRPIRTLTDEEIDQIYSWPDEHYRQRQLWT